MKPQDFNPQDYLPLNYYPWPDLINEYVEEMGKEEWNWIDKDFTFLSHNNREKYKKIALYNVTSRMQPTLNREQILACTRLLFWHTVMDDQYENYTKAELVHIRERMVAIMQGDEVLPGESGLFRQIAINREEFRAFAPQDWFERLTKSMSEYLEYGVEEEAYYRKNNTLPTLSNYILARMYSVGMYPHYDFVEIGLGFPLSESLFSHPLIQRARYLATRITIWQNDIHSLRKELHNEAETFNAVIILQNEHKISIEEALSEIMRIHDSDVEQMVSLQNNHPTFGVENMDIIKEYIKKMGITIQGINSFYILQNYRYTVEGFAWPDAEPVKVRPSWSSKVGNV